jgi:hypothetical protein
LDVFAYRAVMEKPNKVIIELNRAQVSNEGNTYTEIKRNMEVYQAHVTEAPNIAILNELGNDKLWNKKDNSFSHQISNTVEVTFHLIEPVVSDMRYSETGGVFKNVTMEDVLKTTLGYGIPYPPNKKLLEDPTYTGIRGVDVVKPDNTRVYQHVVIPVGTRLMQIPRFLQETYGIFSGGLGWHIDKLRCFVYPLLKNTDYDKRHTKLTILNLPLDEVPTMERTFMVRNKQIFVFATGEKSYENNMEHVQTNLGNGIRYSRATDLIDYMEESTDNKSIWTASTNVMGMLVDKRPDNKQNVRFVPGRFTDNPYKHLSQLTEGLGATLTLHWDNADPTLLYPGMQTQVIYRDEGEIKKIEGTLLGMDYTCAPETSNPADFRSTIRCRLKIFLKRVPEVKL